MSRPELEAAFRSGDGESIRDALISASYSEPADWLSNWCIWFSEHPYWTARYGAAVVLGNIAFAKNSNADLVKCLETVEKLVSDKQPEVSVAAKNSREDILLAIRKIGAS